MLLELSVPYADVRADELALTLGGPVAPALEVLRREVGGLQVELRLLGSSHQAVVDGGQRLVETVDCRPGRPGDLPARRERPGYAFAATVERLSRDDYAARARELCAAASADPDGLVGVFPGPALAFTALRLDGSGLGEGEGEGDGGDDGVRAVRWTSWHGYPQTGELVTTASRMALG